MTAMVCHQLDPVFDSKSRVLILGTIPSPKSRELGFYYGHPRNRFWPVLADVLGERRPETVEEKRGMALRNRIAIWDVLSSCEIAGASDASIRKPVPNNLGRILDRADIRAVFTTGAKAAELYERYCYPVTGRKAILLPSTSPANCRVSYDRLLSAYRVVRDYL